MPFGKGIPDLIPSFTLQPVNVAETLARQFEGRLAIDMGAGGRRLVPWIKTVDLIQLPGTDYVCDFSHNQTPFESGTVDLVVCTGVLEHVEDDAFLMNEILRMLKPGGTVHIEMPFLHQYHDDPIDCRRLTLPGLKLYLEQYGFEVTAHGVHIGPTVTILTLFSFYLDLLFKGKSFISKAIGNIFFAAFSFLAWPLRYLDYWLIKKPTAHTLAFGVYATAVKKIQSGVA